VLPSRNVTVPVAASGDIVAVKLMLAPAAGDVFDATSPTLVFVSWVVTVTAEDVLDA
jgi:hypothetical protein